jgi:Ni,Fe-hydrogenase maturation factor
MSSVSARVLVLGLGKDILTDDAVGLHVVREVRSRLGTESSRGQVLDIDN